MIRTTPLLALLVLPALNWPTQAQESRDFDAEGLKIRVLTVADGLEHPWGLDFLPGGEAIVTEKAGQMRLLTAKGLSEPVKGVPEVSDSGQGGLLDVAVAPDFAQSSTIFFTFSEPGNDGAGTALARARLVRDGADASLTDVKVLFSMNRKSGRGQHFGSRIVHAPDGTIYLTTGDRGERDRAQDMQDHAGAVLRINPDGTIPKDNPFAGSAKAAPEIWSKGHRNIQGAVFDPVTNGLVTTEHGAKGGDEVNQPQAGRNYGWPVISYGVDYSGAKIGEGTQASGYEQPVFYWDPSIAPSGLVSYQGEMFPEWEGDLLVGSLKFALLSRLDRDETGKILSEERLLEGEFGRIRDVNAAPDGSIWLLTDESDGSILKITRAD